MNDNLTLARDHRRPVYTALAAGPLILAEAPMPGTPGDIPIPPIRDFGAPPVDQAGDARVLDLTRRLPPRAGSTATASHASTPAGGAADADLLKLATWIQPVFQARGLSLANPETAAAFRITLGLIETLMEGAQRLGRIQPDGQAYMAAVFEDARTVPDVI